MDERTAGRFWAKVDKNGPIHATKPALGRCHLWTAGRMTSGYGSFRSDAGKVGAHRFAYQLAKGPIPTGVEIRHSCDRRLCCNADHLDVGTRLDNARDRNERGRTARGVWNGAAKLCDAEVENFRVSVMSKHDVLWFDIAMDDSGVVGGGQSACYLNGNINRFTHRQASTVKLLPQCFAFDQFAGYVVS